ncbi:DNA polymerase Y family protein [Pararhodobacter sp.]|uniref:Y-family DNA polymerase n=1 Tax=Pararhodobacter sp. TaxID=2127056 RepID=UPI002B002684|nr:DNA polymerase Y family protein [Pararhodobacter sp.]
MTRRVLSLCLPRLASDLALRRSGEDTGPFALIARQGRGDVLACLNAAAQAQGLRRGQVLSEARALLPTLLTRPHEPEIQRRALAALRRWALRYAPWAAVDGDDGLILDISGAAHLIGGEQTLAEDLRARLATMGLDARIAIAPTRGAAWALARFGDAPIILTDDAQAAIATLPIAALRLPPETCASLARLGLRQVRDLARAQRGSLARRFGDDLMLRFDQAMGALAEPVAAPPDDPVYAIRLTLPEPIGLTSDVMAGLKRLLDRLCATLAAKDRGARRLRFELQRADGTRTEARITLARPMRDAATMAALFERAVEALDAGFGFDGLRLSAPLTEPLPPTQLTGAKTTGTDALADLMTRLGNRLGLDALTRFLPADSHIPERGFQVASAMFTEAPGIQVWAHGPDRPLILFPPEPLPGARGPTPPHRLRWRRRALSVVRATGPERLTPEWWLDDPLWRSGVRDYWRLDCAEGPRLWVFYTPQDPGWAVQGEFA